VVLDVLDPVRTTTLFRDEVMTVARNKESVSISRNHPAFHPVLKFRRRREDYKVHGARSALNSNVLGAVPSCLGGRT
jgi:hypothetical protein